MVGPDYQRPSAPVASQWMATNIPAVTRESANVRTWWAVFNDPVLNSLIETAHRNNPSLQAIGVYVIEAQAQRGIVSGQLFPQQLDGLGGDTRNEISTKTDNLAPTRNRC